MESNQKPQIYTLRLTLDELTKHVNQRFEAALGPQYYLLEPQVVGLMLIERGQFAGQVYVDIEGIRVNRSPNDLVFYSTRDCEELEAAFRVDFANLLPADAVAPPRRIEISRASAANDLFRVSLYTHEQTAYEPAMSDLCPNV